MEDTQVMHARKELYKATSEHQRALHALDGKRLELREITDEIARRERECERLAEVVDQAIQAFLHRQKVAK